MIQENDYVVIRWHDDKSSHVIKVRGEQKLGKTRLSVKPLIGQPYESVFELRDKVLVRVDDDPAFLDRTFDEVGAAAAGDATKSINNSSYVDSNTAQKLDDGDIQEMRDSGATGVDIMKSLIANSETWSAKTEFAQQKWLMRKSRKYLRRFRVCRSTPSLMCDVLFNKSSDNICGLRGDSLAQVLSHGGVYAGARALVFDTTLGLVVGAVAYRMRGNGRILSIFTGQQPHLEYVEPMNLTDRELSIIRSIPSAELAPATDDVSEVGFSPSLDSRSMDLDDPKPNSRASGKPFHSSCKKAHELDRARTLLREGANSLIIVTNFRPLIVLQETIFLLAPSSPFVVHCEYLEPLVECYLFLQNRNLALRLNLTETWMREYQTLPCRFHPQMNMSSSGGYVLSGIYIGSIVVRKVPAVPESTIASVPMETHEKKEQEQEQDVVLSGVDVSIEVALSDEQGDEEHEQGSPLPGKRKR
jgi:tRNA (adenine-N(1)-)-methyltransferase non-catalytic subunit